MAIQFEAEEHKYTSTDGAAIAWLSATGFISKFKTPFDQDAVAIKCSKNRRSKWYGLTPEEIKEIWGNEANRAVTLGSWYHDQREADVVALDTIERKGIEIPIIQPLVDGDLKIAPEQRLTEGIYPEHMVYLKSAKLCGQADRVEVISDQIDLYDYKTNKEIKMTAFKHWDGGKEMMLGPCSHLEDCNFMHYALQLSTYMYIMLKHNHHLKPGKMQLHHIVFEIESKDKYGYPTTLFDPNGDPVVKEVVEYDVPYLKDEVRNMIKWIKLNKL